MGCRDLKAKISAIRPHLGSKNKIKPSHFSGRVRAQWCSHSIASILCFNQNKTETTTRRSTKKFIVGLLHYTLRLTYIQISWVQNPCIWGLFFCFRPKIIPSRFGFWIVPHNDAVNFYTSVVFFTIKFYAVSSIRKYDVSTDFYGLKDTVAMAFRMATVLASMSSKFTSCVKECFIYSWNTTHFFLRETRMKWVP